MNPNNHSYKLIDSGDGRKLEAVGPYILDRPSSAALWKKSKAPSFWQQADARFERTSSQKGVWTLKKNQKIPGKWLVSLGSTKVWAKLTDFGHIGIFPEHHRDYPWLPLIEKRHQEGKEIKVLNLFAYTGALSLTLSSLGAEVVHVDGSKAAIEWGKENQLQQSSAPGRVRWILDDVTKFVKREVRRNSKYHGIVLDPPSFGRGPKSEVWKIEDNLPELLQDLKKLLAKDYCFTQLSSHSQYHSPICLGNVLSSYMGEVGGKVESFEMTVEEQAGRRLLPAGSCAIYMNS